MPELPEVETTCRGIQPELIHAVFQKIVIRQVQLRWPIPKTISTELPGLTINNITRRAKYLLFETDFGTLIIHLGMSGHLRLHQTLPKANKHDHVDFIFHDKALRYTDPRRFGAILWIRENSAEHPLFIHLGPEPLSRAFHTHYLLKKARGKSISLKAFIMNNRVVVGVGNIYATEALFRAEIHPNKKAKDLTTTEATRLVQSIKYILRKAIKAGGTTLKDFYSGTGKPGYFRQQLLAYGREGQPCVNCQTMLHKKVIGQRSTVYCPTCQSL